MVGSSSNGNHHYNLKNAVIAILVPFPSIIFYLTFLNQYYNYQNGDATSLSSIWQWCFDHPLLLAHIFFFLNVNVLFWLIGLIQSNHWMIDLHWTVIPVLLVHYYESHPFLAQENKYNDWRSRIVVFLTWIWSVRLTHNYFRRENWQWGVREDWRFNDMRRQYGKHWLWISFFAVYLSQQVFLMGICMPMYVVHSENMQLNIWDLVGIAICLSGIVIAYYADTQLHDFVSRNNKLKELGKPVVPNLDEGLWHYSRHPNYFGEQLWWWGLVILAWNLGYGWTFVGSLINSLCLAYVTVLVEKRMLKQAYRADAYKLYQKRTSVWIPWFKSSLKGKDKNT